MKRRDAFVDEVAKTVAARHGVERESFVFGLSGRWGEGKTHFLEQLRTKLEDAGFEVIDLNPWKYAADRVAFLRAFLVHLLEMQSWQSRLSVAGGCLCRGQLAGAWAMLLPRRFMLARLTMDVTRQTISWIRLVILLALGAAGYWIVLRVLSQDQRDALGFWKAPAAFLLVTLAVWIAQGVIGSQTRSKAATAVDEFDALTDLALGVGGRTPSASGDVGPTRRVVVFVDDLDRVTSEVARDVLDNLRTFFDKPALSFVVTGDHAVLETNLGREIAPDGALEVQREEGRLFLKKIFNVYWRLPLPVPSDFEGFVDRQLDDRVGEVAEVIQDESDRALLRQWLVSYSGRNLRQVVRMLDTFLFSMRLVSAQLEATKGGSEELAVLEKMMERPMLLGRVLMIQDRCAPFFELLTCESSLLLELDRAIEKAPTASRGVAGTSAVADFLKPMTAPLESGAKPRLKLTPEQHDFLIQFAYERPRFWDHTGQAVPDVAPWIHLACDANFEDSSGPPPEDFIRSLENLNCEAIAGSLRQCSQTRSKAVAAETTKALIETADVQARVDRLDLLLASVLAEDAAAPLVSKFVELLAASVGSLIEGLPGDARVRLRFSFLAAMEHVGMHEIPDSASPAFAFGGPGDFQHIPAQSFGALGSAVAFNWLTTYYSQNSADCLRYLEDVMPRVDLGSLDGSGEALGQRIADDLLADADASRRTARLKLIIQHFPGYLEDVRAAMLEAIDQQGVWDWAHNEAMSDGAPWTMEQLEDALVDFVVAADGTGALYERLRYAAGKLESRMSEMWEGVAAQSPAELAALVDRLIGDSSVASMPMPRSIATSLYETKAVAVKEAVDGDNVSHACGLAQQLMNPAHWIWANVDPKRARKSMEYMARKGARPEDLQTVLRPFFEHWGTLL